MEWVGWSVRELIGGFDVRRGVVVCCIVVEVEGIVMWFG